MNSFQWIWSYIRDQKSKLFIGLILVLSVSGLNMLNPYFAGKIVDDVIIGEEKGLLWLLLIFMIVVVVIKSVIRYNYQLAFEKVSQNVIYDIRGKLYTQLHKLDFSFYDRTRTGDIMARMTGDMEAVRHFTAWTIYMIVENITVLVFALVFMFSIHTPLTLALLIVTPFIGFFAYRLSIDVKPTFSAIRSQFSKLNTVVQENISGNRVVKAFASEDYEIEKFMQENEGFRKKNLESAKIWEKYLPVLDSLAGFLTVVMILVGGIMVITGSLTLGELVTFNSLIWALSNPMRSAGWLLNDVQRFAASAEKIQELQNQKPRIANLSQTVEARETRGNVEFSHVSFRYGDEKVLHEISFEVKSGQTVAIIGPTGAGKSTIVNLLTRFYDVDEGEVKIDGVNVKRWNMYKLRQSMATVMQDVFLFSDTIEGNIAYGEPEATMDQIIHAAKMAEAHDFIEELPDGYETIVGERGIGLSGGQRQRISLARALLRNPAVLILDDTTSAVDMETEKKIQTTLKTVLRDKTCFIIAHRISSVKDADLILVMENGRVIERGTHEELLKVRGHYYKVYQNQNGDFDGLHQREEVM